MAYTVIPNPFVGELIDQVWLNTYVRDNLNALHSAGSAPTGLILPFGDTVANIPIGWHHCDNSGGGIIDLRDCFVIGAGNLYAVGASAGGSSVTPATHSTHVVTQPAHTAHSVTQPNDTHTSFYGGQANGGSTYIAGSTAGHFATAVSNTHAHSSAALSAAHTHGTVSILPPFASRPFMQKVASGLSFTTPITWANGGVPNAANFNQDLRDNPNYLLALIVPQKAMIYWSGSIASLPAGWLLCDGTHTTPDMRDMFVPGSGNVYTPGQTGGQTTQNVGNHGSHTVTQPNNHSNHVITPPTVHFVGSMPGGGVANLSPITNLNDHSGGSIDAHTTHSSFGVDSHTTHADITTLPPFHALALAMLVSGSAITSPKTWTTGEIVQSSEFAAYIQANFAAILAGQFPIGGIGIWSGSIASIPANWQICDGTTGTPNLKDVMPVGAGLTYTVHQTGGTVSTSPAAHTDHSVNQPGGHTGHNVTQFDRHSFASGVGNNFGSGAGNLSAADGTNDQHTGWGVDAHSAHTFTVDSHSAHATISLLPQYKAYAYIQRLT